AVDEIRRWEPKKLRMHIYTVSATIARTARRVVVHVKNAARFAQDIVAGLNRLRSLQGPSRDNHRGVRVRSSRGNQLGSESPPNRVDTRWPRHTRMAKLETNALHSARIKGASHTV